MASMGKGSESYYLNLAAEDYYLEGGEPPGLWMGKGAEELGLSGEVQDYAFKRLFWGYSPFAQGTDGKLTQNAGKNNRHPGWDLTFSAPKSVSVLWSQADRGIRETIQELQRLAAERTISFLESRAVYTKRGHAGESWEKATGLTVALFEHGTSRAQDPQLHTHAVVFNYSKRSDGTRGTILGLPLFRLKMTAGALYRAELASLLEKELGLPVIRKDDVFEIDRVPDSLIEHFSKRRTEIEESLKKTGHKSAKAAAIAALETREQKDNVSRKTLFERWAEDGKEFGFVSKSVYEILNTVKPRRSKNREIRDATKRTLDYLTGRQDRYKEEQEFSTGNSYFTENQFIRRFAEESIGRGLSLSDAEAAAKDYISQFPDIYRVGKINGEAVYTTDEILGVERKLMDYVEKSRDNARHFITKSRVAMAAHKVENKRGISLLESQKEALFGLTTKPGSIQVLSGLAGTGKTALLEAARVAWEQNGFKVIGASLSGKAANGLQEGAGIQSDTIAMRLLQLKPKKLEAWMFHGKRFRYVRSMFRYADKVTKPSLKITKNTILVVDEAGMVDTRQMAALVKEVISKGGKIVLVGDERQLQALGPGGAFAAIGRVLGAEHLNEVIRQNKDFDWTTQRGDPDWKKKAISNCALGDPRLTLYEYGIRGLLNVSDTRNDAMRKLVDDWKEHGISNPKDNLILAATHAEVQALNQMAQKERFHRGPPGSDKISTGRDTIYEGDRVLFTKNSRTFDVRNGDLGTVLGLDTKGKRLSVELDSGKRVIVSLRHYHDVQLGYAVTTHKAQGITVKNSFVLSGGSMQDKELTYVQLSRASETTKIYIDELSAGAGLTQLGKDVTRSHQKLMALDIRKGVHEQSQDQERKL